MLLGFCLATRMVLTVVIAKAAQEVTVRSVKSALGLSDASQLSLICVQEEKDKH